MIDTHTHLYLDEFQPSPADAVRRAIDAGVDKMIFPNIDASTIESMKALMAEFPSNIFPAMGLHPSEVREDWLQQLQIIKKELDTNDGLYKAVGEIGIDLYWDKSFEMEQMQAFYQQCLWALEKDLPIIIHCREALDQVLEVLKSLPAKPRGVMHSFGGTVEDVKRIREIVPYFYFGINGIVTFKNSKLREVLPEIGLNKILLETDSPYLAPVPMRGRRNESAYIVHVAAHIADFLNVPLKTVEEETSRSARSLFNL